MTTDAKYTETDLSAGVGAALTLVVEKHQHQGIRDRGEMETNWTVKCSCGWESTEKDKTFDQMWLAHILSVVRHDTHALEIAKLRERISEAEHWDTDPEQRLADLRTRLAELEGE